MGEGKAGGMRLGCGWVKGVKMTIEVLEDGFKGEGVVLELGMGACENWGSGRGGRREPDFFWGGGFGEGHAWEFREMENRGAGKGALRSARRKESRFEIGERVGSGG